MKFMVDEKILHLLEIGFYWTTLKPLKLMAHVHEMSM
jgi:hypothetical protein